jgi:hypothetical protein
MRTLSKRADFGYLLNEQGLSNAGAEVGVFRGDFAAELLEKWSGKKLYLIDTWRHLDDYLDSWNLDDGAMEENYRTTINRVSRWQPIPQLLRMPSLTAAKRFGSEELDFVYLDANHSFEHVRADIIEWFDKVRIGGIMSGHDYFNAIADKDLEPIHRDDAGAELSPLLLTSYGVKAAVDEFTEIIGAELNIIREELPTWCFEKSNANATRFRKAFSLQ